MDGLPTIDFERIGLIGTLGIGLIVTIAAFHRQWIVPGATYREKAEECRRLVEITQKTLDVCEMMRSLMRRNGS